MDQQKAAPRQGGAGKPPAKDLPSIPPHNLDAERAVLGAMLYDRNALLWAVEHLSPLDFYSTPNRLIFNTAKKLAEAESPVDLITVFNAVKNSPQLEEIGGMAYLASLEAYTTATSNTPYHGKILREYRYHRLITQESQYLLQEIKDNEEPNAIVGRVARIEEFKKQLQSLEDEFREPAAIGLKTLLEQELGPPEDEYWGQFLSKRSGAVLGADKKTGKTMFGFGLAIALACGFPKFLGHKITQCRVLYLEREVSLRKVQSRFKKMCETCSDWIDLDLAEKNLKIMPESYLILGAPQMNGLEPPIVIARNRAAFEYEIEHFHPDVIFIDPLYHFFPGNEGVEHFNAMIAYLETLKQRFDVAIVLVHHIRKAGIVYRYSESILDRLRGYSTLGAWPHTIVGLLWPDSQAETDRSHVRMEIVARDAEEDPKNVVLRRCNKACPWFSVDDDYKRAERLGGRKAKASTDDVVALITEHGPMMSKALLAKIEESLNISRASAYRLLKLSIEDGSVCEWSDSLFRTETEKK